MIIVNKNGGKRFESGYEAGFAAGYHIGRQQGVSSFFQHFRGTSIIILSANQEASLRRCLDSIFQHTQQLYEIIVIDHGSEDGTGKYLETVAYRVKAKRFSAPLGYAAAVNQGLRLARGESMLVMEAGSSVTESWLENVLSAYREHSDADHQEMPPVGLLMRSDVFRRMGYMTEELDDRESSEEEYRCRALRLGLNLMIRGKMARYPEGASANRHNSLFSNEYYPSHLLVKDCAEVRYWVEEGLRHPVENGETLAAPMMSRIELQNWPVGSLVSKEDCLKRLGSLSSVPSSYGPIAEGVLVRDSQGNLYQSLKGDMRRFAKEDILKAWGMEKRPVYGVSDDILKEYHDGVPIEAPPVIRSANL